MDSSRQLQALNELCTLGLHPEVLVPAVLEGLHQVVPSYRNLFDWTDERGQLVRYFIEGPIDTAVAQLYFDEFHNRREPESMLRYEALQRVPAGVRSAAELDNPVFFGSDYYHAIWRPQGFRTRLQAVLRNRAGQLLGSLVLYRGPSAPRFTARDERHLAALLPAFAQGLQAHGPARADVRHVPSPDLTQTILMTLQGEICHASPGAHRLLMMAEGGVSRGALSRPLDALAGRLLTMLLQQLRERAASSPLPDLAPPPSITCESASGRYVAQGELLRPRIVGAAPLVQVTLSRLEPHGVALERALRRLPITPGQMAVCRWLYHGRSQAEIGQQLGVATATVVDHVRKVYRRLDLCSTLELRALLDGQMPTA